MKVGILSMQRVKNYGSFLQAYALKSIVEGFGHECSFLDFKPGEPRHIELNRQHKSFLRNFNNVYGKLKRRIYSRKYFKQFGSKFWPYLGLSKKPSYDGNYDLVVIGSDEVFNYTQNTSFGFVPQLFGHNIDAKNIITYAASTGYATLEDIKRDGVEDEIKMGFNRISDFAVRDENTYDIVKNLSGKNPVFTLDPTLIYDFNYKIPDRLIEEDYILVYAYPGRMDGRDEINAVRKFARKKKMKLVATGFYQFWCDNTPIVNPFELLSLFKNASYVIADTFHGTICSIKFNRQFGSFVRSDARFERNSNKLGFLLKQAELEDRAIRKLEDIEVVMDKPINYDNTNAILEKNRVQSLNYLKKWLVLNA